MVTQRATLLPESRPVCDRVITAICGILPAPSFVDTMNLPLTQFTAKQAGKSQKKLHNYAHLSIELHCRRHPQTKSH